MELEPAGRFYRLGIFSDIDMKIIAAPGPVSYPLILATREYRDLDLVFGKGNEEPSAYAIADSLTSLVRSGLRIDVVTVRRLMFVYPELRGPRVAVWRRGSAADVLIRALLDRAGLRLNSFMRMIGRQFLTSLTQAMRKALF